jgi:hypothetical protein
VLVLARDSLENLVVFVERGSREIVPESERTAEKYSGITFIIHVAELNKQWKLIT